MKIQSNLLQDIKEAFNSEIVNYLVGQVQQCNQHAKEELLHVMSVSCDLRSPVNKKYKALYDELVSTQENLKMEQTSIESKISVDFKNLIKELKSKKLKLCFINGNIFIENAQGNLYSIELIQVGTYLDKLINEGTTVWFTLLDESISCNIPLWKKETWGILEVEEFINRHIF